MSIRAMKSGTGTGIVSAFYGELLQDSLIILVIAATLVLAWFVAHRRARSEPVKNDEIANEPPGRRLLRLGFGSLWVLDGLLQAQSSMPLGMVPRVIAPAAATSPVWVQHLAGIGSTAWSAHPVELSAAAVFIQVGLGLWLLLTSRGTWSRLAGVASTIWGLAV